MSNPPPARAKSISRSLLGLLGIAIAIAWFMRASEFDMMGRYDNRADPKERIEFRGGKAHVYSSNGSNGWMEFTTEWIEGGGDPNYPYTAAQLAAMRYKVQAVDFTRQGKQLTLHTPTGDRAFTVHSDSRLTGPNDTTWDRKYSGD